MPGLRFETAGGAGATAPDRVDAACFVGFVERRPGAPLPPALLEWLRGEGWAAREGALRPPRHARPAAEVEALLDVPVPLESWEAFDHLFAWDARAYPGGRTGGSYLGAAVRSFFAEGGRRCFVVRVGDPLPFGAPREARLATLQALLPGWPREVAAHRADRAGWRGAGHLLGLPEVSFLALPDLAELVAAAPVPVPVPPPLPPPPERFRECAPEPAPAPDLRLRALRAPRADREAFGDWAAAVRAAGAFLRASAREVQLVASVPLAAEGVRAAGSGAHAGDELLRFLAGEGWLRGSLAEDAGSVASAFVQLAYPWVRTGGSARLPEGIEPPEGALAGMLARNALLRGTFRSAAALEPAGVWGVEPVVGRDQLEGAHRDPAGREPARTLGQRVSLFGPTPRGVRLLSDVTTARDESYRPAGVGRLVAAVVRAARRVGEELAFGASGPALWSQVETSLATLLASVEAEGALRTPPGEPAFEVRCDRSTMSEADLDAGRVVAVVTLAPAAAVERITVVLGMEEGGVRVLEPAAALEAAA